LPSTKEPSTEERIAGDAEAAMRAGDRELLRTLRVLRSELHNAAIQAGGALSEDDAIGVLQKQAKQRRDSIEAFQQGGRQDLVAQESAELAIVEAYLPRQLTDEEVESAARDVIARVAAADPSDMGRVMGPLMEQLQGRADGKRVSATVRRLLAG
jgi:hypothetical protein